MSAAPSGGCQCGALRYRLTARPHKPILCHCRMCQKAHGAPAVSWVSVPRAALEWTRGAPAGFRSSERAERLFCARCGTPLVFVPDDADHVDVAAASLDDPEAFPPARQSGIEARMGWFGAAHGLPEEETGDNPGSRQHPDRDTAQWPETEDAR